MSVAHFAVMTVVVILASAIEQYHKMHLPDRDEKFFFKNRDALYMIFYVHVRLSAGAMGFHIAVAKGQVLTIVMLALLLAGSLCRGLANKAGGTNWRWGVFIPNAMGLTVFCIGAFTALRETGIGNRLLEKALGLVFNVS